MAVRTDGERAQLDPLDRVDDEGFPSREGKGGGRPLIVFAAVVLTALAAWIVLMVTNQMANWW